MKVLEETVKLSSIHVVDSYDVEQLQLPYTHLIPCTILWEQEYLDITYSMEHLHCMNEAKDTKLIGKLKLLIAAGRLESLSMRYKFSLCPENLFYTEDTIIKVKKRDVLLEEFSYTFVNDYKCLIGCMLLNEYSYEDIKQGGISLLKHSRWHAITDCRNVPDILRLLHCWHNQELENQKKMILVPKKKHAIYKSTILITSTLLISLSIFVIYQQFFILNTKEKWLQASSHFMNRKYVDVIDTLKNEDLDKLHEETKYMLAVSYIKSSNLKGQSRENALSLVRLNGTEDYIMFWIYLGKKDFENVYAIANTFNDNRLLYYAYSVELESLNTNTELSTREKQKRKKELEELLEVYISDVENDNTGLGENNGKTSNSK